LNFSPFSIYERLLAIVGPLDQVPLPMSSSQSPCVAAAIAQPSEFDQILSQTTPEPKEIVAMCAQLGDTILVHEVVAATQGSYAWQHQPQAEKRPTALCRHLACSKQHSPDDCCICSGQRHPIEKRWHVTGLPAGKQHMAD
jgi:hypothetical protein